MFSFHDLLKGVTDRALLYSGLEKPENDLPKGFIKFVKFLANEVIPLVMTVVSFFVVIRIFYFMLDKLGFEKTVVVMLAMILARSVFN